MAITRKARTKAESVIFDEQLEGVIDSGGGTATQANDERPKQTVKFTLTLPADICADVDQLRSQERISVSRHRWVVEAILMRIEQEKG